MKSLLVLCAACAAGLLFAAPSFAKTSSQAARAVRTAATDTSPSTTAVSPAAAASGYVEVCKQSGTPGVTGSFSFTIDGIETAVTVGTGLCSAPMAVPAGQVAVTE